MEASEVIEAMESTARLEIGLPLFTEAHARRVLRAAFDRALELARDSDVSRHPMSVSEDAWGLLHTAAYGDTDE